MTTFYAFVAGYAVCRAVDAAFDRRWRAVGVTIGAALLMLAFSLRARL